MQSNAGLPAAVYYAVMPLIVPFSAAATYIFSSRERDGSQKYWLAGVPTGKQRLASAALGLILCAMGVLFLFAFEGQDARLIAISGSVGAVVTKGWIPFAVAGCLIGSGLLFLRRAIS